jgi:hypothetical protein
MDTEEAKALCAKHGSALQKYELGRVASITLPSGEMLIVSIGTTTAKILIKHPIFGWFFPKIVGKKNLSDWVPGFLTLPRLQRFAAGAMVLDGLVSLSARANSAAELSLAWTVLRNPVEIAVTECGWGPTTGK